MTPRHLAVLTAACSVVVAAGIGLASRADDDAKPSVPFHLPNLDDSDSPASMAFLNDGPADKRMIVAGPHILADGERMKFWGVNICGGAAFPDKDKADAIAGHLAKLGINNVRLHHLDNNWQTENIFGDIPNKTTRQLDPKQMDELSYFIAALKKHGIYSNINVLCSRRHVEGDGVPQDVLDTPWKLSHTLAFVDDELRDLHKETARQLLTHKNPYTGLTFAEDPAVAIVEITNENGLIQPFLEGAFYQMPERHQQMLTAKWNDWLAERYGNRDAIAEAWQSRTEPLGDDLLRPLSPENYNAIAQ